MQRLLCFPRLLRFQKWLGFIILDVNSCSNLAFTDQEQCQGRPSEPRWQQVSPNQKPAGKTSRTILQSYYFCFLFPPAPSFLCSDLDLCYFKTSHLKVISSDR